MGALSSTSPIQNTSESPSEQAELNDNKITVEQVPKPRKFFKSRNSAPAEIQQQISIHQQSTQQHNQSQQQSYQNHYSSQSQHETNSADDEEQSPKKARKKKQPALKKEKAPKPEKPPKPEKIPKPKKEKKVKVVKEIPEPVSDPSSSEAETSAVRRGGRSVVEPTRSSGRSRAKCVNYNEDAGEDEFYNRIDRRIVPRHMVPATITSPQAASTTPEPAPVQAEPVQGPSPHQSPLLHPPIVLRISKVRSTSV